MRWGGLACGSAGVVGLQVRGMGTGRQEGRKAGMAGREGGRGGQRGEVRFYLLRRSRRRNPQRLIVCRLRSRRRMLHEAPT